MSTDLLRIPQSNDFTLCFPWYEKTFDEQGEVILDPLPLEEATNLVVTYSMNAGVSWLRLDSSRVRVLGNRVYTDFLAGEVKGRISIKIILKLSESNLACSWFDAVEVVSWTNSSNYTEYVQGSPYLMPSNVAVLTSTTYILARQKTLVEGIETLSNAIKAVADVLPTLAKQGSSDSANITEIYSKLLAVADDALAAKIAAQSIVGYALESSVNDGIDTTISVLKSAQVGLAKLRELLDAIPTDTASPQEVIAAAQAAAQAVIEAFPNDYAKEATSQQILTEIEGIDLSGLATEANATINKQAILNAIAAAVTALQGNDSTATLVALKTAIDNIDLSDLAKQATLEAVGRDAEAAKLAAQSIAIPTDYAKEASVRSGNVTAISQITNSNYGLSALKSYLVDTIYDYLVSNIYEYLTNTLYIDVAKDATVAHETSVKSGNDTAISVLLDSVHGLSALKSAILGVHTNVQSAEQSLENKIDVLENTTTGAIDQAIVDINQHTDTTVDTAKDAINAKLGSPSASQQSTIFAQLAANLSSILGTDPTVTLTALSTAIAAIPTVAQIQAGLASEQNATSNKNDIINALVVAKNNLQGTDSTATLTDTKTVATNAYTSAEAAKTAAQAIVGYALQGSDSNATNTALEILLQSIITTMYKGVPIVSQSGNATISPNTWNVWESSLSSLTVTKGSDISGVLNVYSIRFLAGSNFQLSFSGFGSVVWVNGVVPTFVAGHIYEISIVESRGVWAEF